MSATIYEPYRLPAGILALLVHSVFFALLYFGFNWNRQVSLPATMSVELWPSLPEEVVPPPVELKVAEVTPPPQQKIVEPEIVKPDIVIPEKKKVAVKPEKKKPEPKVVERVQPKPEIQKPAEDMEARRIADEQAARVQAERIRQDQQTAAKNSLVDEYKAKIQAKIQRNVVMPPDVANDARAKFLVTLLPGGAVLKAELKKSSGNVAYDNAVERAILKSSPLPLPPDAQLFSNFRELDLGFQPTE
ncbi:MAG: cell envelope integrity protein TolA [Gallionella sp.]